MKNYNPAPDTQIIPKEIAEKAGCLYGIVKDMLKEGVTKIIIEDGAKMVGWDLLRDCTEITSVTIPDSVEIIAEGAFQGCTSLTEIIIPDSVKVFGKFPFIDTPWEKNHTEDYFIAGDGVLLKYQSDESRPVIPSSVKKIGFGAFCMDCDVTSVTLPDTVKEIDFIAFNECKNLKEINIPESVEKINTLINRRNFFMTPWYEKCEEEFMIVGDGILLKYNGSDTKITIPDNVKKISSIAFEHAPQVSEITFSGNLRYVEGFALHCTEWYNNYKGDFVIADGILIDYKGTDETVIIPDNIRVIGEYAFVEKPVRNVIIPKSVTLIADSAFEACAELESVTIPNSVTAIGMASFRCCKNLKRITIPESVKKIGDVAFSYCESLDSVNIMGTDVEIGIHAFAKESDCVMPEN